MFLGEWKGQRNLPAEDIVARGPFQRIDYARTSITGYADVVEIFYWYLLLFEVFKSLVITAMFNNGTLSRWLIIALLEGITGLLFSGWSIFDCRSASKRLARIVEHLVAAES
jgi:hypothetical protein